MLEETILKSIKVPSGRSKEAGYTSCESPDSSILFLNDNVRSTSRESHELSTPLDANSCKGIENVHVYCYHEREGEYFRPPTSF